MRARTIYEAESAVGIGSGGRGGYGKNNMLTPQSQRAYVHQEETEEKEEELGDLDLGDLKGEFFNENLEFEENIDPYKSLKIGKFHNAPSLEVTDEYIIINVPKNFIGNEREEDGLLVFDYIEDGRWKRYEFSHIEWDDPYSNNIDIMDKWVRDNIDELLSDNGNPEDLMESLNFEEDMDPYQALNIGSGRIKHIKFKDPADGAAITIEVKNNQFFFYDMQFRLEFVHENPADDSSYNGAKLYVDNELDLDMNIFQMAPAQYEFFVPKKPSLGAEDDFKDNPDESTWSKTKSAYGLPLVDENDKKKLKEMQDKYSSWMVLYGDYTRTAKDPFAAVAKMIMNIY